MNNKKLLIASSSKNEAITKWVINEHLNNVDLIFIDDLLNRYSIQDELDDIKTAIHWYENDTLKYSNKTHCLLNRIPYIDKKLYSNFKCHDQDYARREFEAYLGFALNSFDKVQNIAINGICERIYSLPQQWNLIRKKISIAIPNYYWGSKDYTPFASDAGIVYSSIYNFLNWSSDNRDFQSSGFCFKKPEGEPVFVLSIGDSRLISSDTQLTNYQLNNLDQILRQIKEIFKYFIFELLVFIDKNELIYGCINIDILRSQNNSLFSDFLHTNLIREFYKCLN